MKRVIIYLKRILLHLVLISGSVVIAFPFFWMITNSVKSKDEIWRIPPKLLPDIMQWINYKMAIGDGKLVRYMWNSTYTSVIIVVIVLINSAMFAYALNYIHFRGRNLLFALIMVTYIMPVVSTYIPAYVFLAKIGLINTHGGYIFSGAASIFNIFYFKMGFSQINKSILEAARVDGAGHLSIFMRIVTPMSRSSYATLGILTFVGSYNNYLWPSLILKDKDKFFVSMGLRAFYTEGGAYGMEWGAIMASCCIIIFPLILLYLFGEKWIISGMTSDAAVKE